MWQTIRSFLAPLIKSRSSLWMSILENQNAAVDKLIDSGMDVNEAFDVDVWDKYSDHYEQGTIPLHVALMRNDIDLFEILMRHQADVNARLNQNSPLCLAMLHRCSLAMIEMLMDNGADFNEVDNLLYTLLHKACEQGNVDMVKALLKRGIDVTATNIFDETALHSVIKAPCKNFEIAKLLLRAGAPIDGKYKNAIPPLFKAILKHEEGMAHFFLKKGANVRFRSEIGENMLHVAIELGRSTALIELLLEKGANVTDKIVYDDELTPLALACNTNSEEYIHLLIEYGASLRKFDYIKFLTTIGDRKRNAAKGILLQLAISKPEFCNDELDKIPLPLRSFYAQCLEELKVMKTTKFYNDWTIYDLFLMDKKKILILSKRENFIRGLKHSQLFPLYKIPLDIKIKRAERIWHRYRRIEQHVQNSFLFHLPDLVIEHIIDYLKPDDVPTQRKKRIEQIVQCSSQRRKKNHPVVIQNSVYSDKSLLKLIVLISIFYYTIWIVIFILY